MFRKHQLIAQRLLVPHLRLVLHLVLNNCPSENEKEGDAARRLASRRGGGGLASGSGGMAWVAAQWLLTRKRRDHGVSPIGNSAGFFSNG